MSKLQMMTSGLSAKFVAAFIFLAVCSLAQAFPVANYLPLTAGDSWTGAEDGVVLTETVLANSVLINGVSAVAVQSSNGDVTFTTNDANGIREIGYVVQNVAIPNYGMTSSTVDFNPPLVDMPADVALGQIVNSAGTATVTYTGLGTYTLSYTGQSSPTAFETITVPAGTFNALKIQQQLSISGVINGVAVNSATVQTLWVAANVGVLRRDSTDTTNGVSTSHRYVLNSYNVFIPVVTPAPFVFTPKTDVVPGMFAASNPITVTGINVASPISIIGGEYSVNGGAYSSAAALVKVNDLVTVRLKASVALGATSSALLTIGGVSAAFDATTLLSVPTGNVLFYSSQAGDYIGQGVTEILSTSNQYTVSGVITYLESFNIASATGSWTLNLRSPTNTPLTVGSYENVQRAPFAPAGVPGLEFTGNGRGCNTVTGRFDVLDAAHDASGNIQKMAVNFEQHCEGGTSALFGQLRYNSALPVDFGLLATFNAGWNLAGNSRAATINVASVFADSTKVVTVWKWVPATSRWAFYAPSMTATALASYAAGKGYDVLTSINAGEGFWVNAQTAFSVPLPPGMAIGSATFADQSLPLSNGLPIGWSLIAVGDNPTPRSFVNTISTTPPVSPVLAANSLITLWAWDGVQSNWYFYAPSLDNSAGLAAYIASKSYLPFANKALDPSMGFWVNHP